MTYRAGTRGLEPLGIASGEPRIICDGCGSTHPITTRQGHVASWWLRYPPGAPPRWRSLRRGDGSQRWDLCPECLAPPPPYDPQENERLDALKRNAHFRCACPATGYRNHEEEQ